jgi:hypothetical protein
MPLTYDALTKQFADYFQRQGWEIESNGQQTIAIKQSWSGEDSPTIVNLTDLAVVIGRPTPLGLGLVENN